MSDDSSGMLQGENVAKHHLDSSAGRCHVQSDLHGDLLHQLQHCCILFVFFLLTVIWFLTLMNLLKDFELLWDRSSRHFIEKNNNNESQYPEHKCEGKQLLLSCL